MTVMALKKKNNMKKGPFKLKSGNKPSPTKFFGASLPAGMGTGDKIATNPRMTGFNPNTNRLLAAAKNTLGVLRPSGAFANLRDLRARGGRIRMAPGFKPKTRVGKRGLRGFLSRFF